MADFGYAGEILKVDLSDGEITRLPTSDYAERFLGGRGIAARLYWDMVPPQTGALDPENCFICASGPAAGFTRLAGFRWKIFGKSPAGEPEAFSHANLGDSWGIKLKYAGYDALVVRGKAEKLVYIHDGTTEIKDASHLWGRSAFDAGDSLKAELGREVSVLSIGPAAENMVTFATVLADGGASGSGGLGSVMGSKMLKAVAVAGGRRPTAAHPGRLSTLADRFFRLAKGNEPLQYLRFNRECIVLGRDGEAASRQGTVVERAEFEEMKDEYYALRGWDIESGLQTRAGLEKLGLKDIADDLESRGLLK